MKKIMYLCLTVLAFSCSNDPDLEESIVDTNTTDNSNESFNERAGDGIYDLLGAGYDVTGDYANASAAGNQVLNIPEFKRLQASKFTDQILTEAPTYKETYGENALTFSQNLSYSLDATSNFYLFGSTFDQSNTMTDFTFNEKYIFGSYNLVKKQKRLKVTTTIAELKNYLMPKFIADINDKSAAEIVENYGTHVLLDIYTGASMEVLFQSQTTNTDRIAASRSGVKSSFLYVYEQTVNNNSNIADNSKNFDKKLFYETRGGDPSKGIIGELNLNQTVIPKLNYTQWLNSSTVSNSVLVDFGKSGLTLIYEFIDNPTKKAQVKTYIEQYLNNRKVKLFFTPPPPAPVNVSTIFGEPNLSWTGWVIRLPVGNYTMGQLAARGIPNDAISSLVTDNGYEAVMYFNDNFQGTSKIYTNLEGSFPNMGGIFPYNHDNQYSSVIIRRRL